MMQPEKLLKLASDLVVRREEVGILITDPAVIADAKRYAQLAREYKRLEALYEHYQAYQKLEADEKEAQETLADTSASELHELAEEQLAEAREMRPKLLEKIMLLLLPESPDDGKNAIVEIRAGTGGDEAALFARDLFKMYSNYCSSQGWRIEISHSAEGSVGGLKEIIFTVEGSAPYGTLKFESGVHRVQRVPATETQGRVHTSAATVAVFPEADECDVELKESDVRVDTYCASGPGGQGVNTTYSAVRLTHIPTGLVVQCQDTRSQLKNKEQAMKELRSRLYDMEKSKQEAALASQRKSMVSTGDRSAKIRTYNFPQGRLTDHRIGLTLYNLQAIIDGDLQPVVDALAVADNAAKLESATHA